MAHIADLMINASNSTIGLNNYIARELSPHPSQDAVVDAPAPDEKEKHVWRLHQPNETRKYQLFPGIERLSLAVTKNSELESVSTMASGPVLEKGLLAGNPLRRPKEQTLIRRRKISVPELGPMTTVQEVAMDSPTIPGRPPLHERSISAPGNTWRNHMFGENTLSCIGQPAFDETAEFSVTSSVKESNIPDESASAAAPRPVSPRRPLSPKSLAPLVIPTSQSHLRHQISATRLRSDDHRPEVPPKSAKPKDGSPYRSPFTPMSSTTNLSLQSSITTPQSAPEGRSSPKPWSVPRVSQSPSALGHSRGQSDASATLATQQALGHRRGESDGSGSVMSRGRPKKRRADSGSSPMKPPVARRSPSLEEQQAFAILPVGIKAIDAHTALSPTESDILRKQAVGQASRFEVLHSKDVDSLSRELRGLDERCEYLRKTHRSLRAGRRNLHDRICSYLRSPRVAKFSYESILKQEEALSELDSSIDDWVTKLELAENRRTRVRQKLLEHVAAALIMQPPSPVPQSNGQINVLNRALTGENTPPRSPTKREATSPRREERVVDEVRVASPETTFRESTQSIRIYADSDMYALLADVEEEISRMGEMTKVEDRVEDRDAETKCEKNEDTKEVEITLTSAIYEGLPAKTYNPSPPYTHRNDSSNTLSGRS